MNTSCFYFVIIYNNYIIGAFGSVFKGRILPKSEVKNRTINIQVAIKTIKGELQSVLLLCFCFVFVMEY